MQTGLYIVDQSGASFATVFRPDRILADVRSEFQRITVFESAELGRGLMLDSIFNVSTVMEAFYHEPMAHIPLAVAGSKESVLIIGGGDFGVVHHLLKHGDLQSVTICELDGKVLDVAREFFPQWAVSEADPRLSVRVGDGAAWLSATAPQSLDAVIIDSTDPFEKADMLVSEPFYRSAAAALKPGGALIQIVADAVLYRDVWRYVVPRVRCCFSSIRPLFVPIPFYATGAWGLIVAVKGRGTVAFEKVTREYLDSIGGVRTLTPELVRGWASLPPFLADAMGDLFA